MLSNLFDSKGNVKLGVNLIFDFNHDGVDDFAVSVDTRPDSNGNVTVNISDGITTTSLTVPYIAP